MKANPSSAVAQAQAQAEAQSQAQLDLASAAPRVRSVAQGERPAVEVALAAQDALLLAWLALEGPTPRERLAQLLWPASDAEDARNALRQRLFRLRRQSPVALVSGTTLLSLAEGVAHDLAGADSLLGDLRAPGCDELDRWLGTQRQRRWASRRVTLESQIDAFEAASDWAQALPLAVALVDDDPNSEDAHRRLMRLHYLRGDRAAAMLAFDRCEQWLKHEVGTRPSAQTLELLATIERSATLPDAPLQRERLPAALLRPPTLVGREPALRRLRQALAQGQSALIVGAAGLGKSRLLQALAQEQRAVIQVQGRPGDPMLPFSSARRSLRQLLDLPGAQADAALRGQVALLLAALAGVAPTSAAQQALMRPVLELVERSRTVVDLWVLDDLHLADAASLDLLHALLAAPPGEGQAPIRWALAFRPAATGTRLHGLEQALRAAPQVVCADLSPLSADELGELVGSLGLADVDSSALGAALFQRTGGNPLFALETLKQAWQEGSLQRQPPLLASDLPQPPTMAHLIGQQLARLSPRALALARVAAVAGVDFSLPLAEALAGRPALELVDAWAELEAQQVLRGTQFAHDLLHAAVLQGLPEVIARHLHGQAAAWLDAAQGEAARVAAHWLAAAQPLNAVPALRRAAANAHRLVREDERIAFLLQAADIVQGADQPDAAFELIFEALDAHMNSIRHADGLPLVARLERLARLPGQRALAAGSRAWYATVMGDQAEAITWGRKALRLARPTGDEAMIARIGQRLGTALGMAGQFDEALTLMRKAEPWVVSNGRPDELNEFQGNLAVLLDNLGRPAEAQTHHEQALALAQSREDRFQQATLLANYALSRLDAGDVLGASVQAGAAQAIVEGQDMMGSSAGFVATLNAQCARAQGHYQRALAHCDRAELILAQRNAARLPVAWLHRAHIWLDLGQHARALQLLDGDALAVARKLPPRYAVRWLVLLARVYRRIGRGAQAQALCDEAVAAVPQTGWPELRWIALTEQAQGLPPAQALQVWLNVAAQARQGHLGSAELGALLLACAPGNGGSSKGSGESASAGPRVPTYECPVEGFGEGSGELSSLDSAVWAEQALALSERASALHTDPVLRWLHTAQALQLAGHTKRAAALAQQGRDWLLHCADHEMAAEFRPSFLQGHPGNRALMNWRP